MAVDIVLGGGGFVGHHLARYLVACGRQVIVVGRHPPVETIPDITHVNLDLYDCGHEQLAELLAPAEVIYHLAWSNLPASAENDVEGDLRTNVGFVTRLLCVLRNHPKRLVFCSSGGTVYGISNQETVSEDQPLKPINAYGAAKVTGEVYCGFFYEAYGVDVRVARLANPYGLGQSSERLQGAVSRFVPLAMTGKPIDIWGDGEVVRDYIDIGDAVAGLYALGSMDLLEGQPRTYNIATGRGTSLNDLVKLIGDITGTPLEVRYFSGRRIDVPRNVLSIDLARRYLAWQPRLSLEQGIRQLVEALRHDHHQQVAYRSPS